MANNNETTTKFKVDISELKSAMQEAKRQISVTNSEFKAISSSMDNWGKSTDGIKAKLKQLDSNLKNQKTVLSNLEKQYEQVAKEQGEGSKAAENLKIAINNQKAVVNGTEKQIKTYGNALNTAEKAEKIAALTGRDASEVFDELADSAEDAGEGAEKSSKGFTVMKGALADLVADGIRKAVDALKDFAKASIQTGMDFEASMSEVQAISGASGEQLELLTKTAKEYGATTTFSASEAADALKYMALAGWDAEKSSSALGGVLDLAAASGMDLASASDMVTDYLSAFGLEAEQSTYFADMLAFAQGNANTSAEQLGEAYKNCAANLNAAGQDVETVTSLLSMMANQGLKGSEAGTALTAIMRDMTAKMKDGAIAIGDTSVQVMDANGNYRDMTDILKDVEAATNGMGDAERAAALSTTFTSDSTKGLNLLLNAGVGEAEKFEEALRGSRETAGEMAKVMNDNLAGDVKAAQSAFEDLQITAYDELQPTLRDIVKYVTNTIIPTIKNDVIPVIKDEVIPAIKEFVGWIVDNKDEILATLAGIAAGFAAFKIVGTIMSLVGAFKKFQAALVAGKTVMQALNITMAANPIGLIVAAIAALVAGFIYLWNTSEGFRNFWIGLWETISTAFSTAWDAIVKFFTETLPEVFNSVIEWIKSNWQSILLFLINPFAGLFKYFYDNNEKFKEFVDTAIKYIKELPTKVWTWLLNTINKVNTWRINMINKAKEAGSKFIAKVIEFICTLPSKIWTWLINVINKVITWKNDMVAKAKEAGSEFIAKVIDKVKSLPEDIKTQLTNVINKIVDWKNDLGTKGKEAATELFDKVVEKVKELPDKVKEIAGDVVTGLWNGMNDKVEWLKEKIKGFVGDVTEWLKKFFKIGSPSKLMAEEVGQWLPKGIAVGIDKNAKSVLSSMKDLTTDTVVTARNGLSNASEVLGVNGGKGVINFYQTNNSPKALSRLEIYRQSKNLLGYAGGV